MRTYIKLYMYSCFFVRSFVYLRTFPRTADPAKEARPTPPRAPAAKVCPATCKRVSSGITTTAPAAAANEASPAALNAEGGTVTAVAKRGRAWGASSTTLGNKGKSSGVAASTKMRISLFSAARARRGSNLERERPASWALESKPDWATLVNKPLDSTFSNKDLTAMLFPRVSTSSRMLEAARGADRVDCVCVGTKAEAEAANKAAIRTWNFIVGLHYFSNSKETMARYGWIWWAISSKTVGRQRGRG
mmetsp:Transcript_10625/g.25170  ORF Transcript_10625/g.25170 Transcript_10625/m.25170 type:complete len:248 (+) Transcript_10625:3446-4189(+)